MAIDNHECAICLGPRESPCRTPCGHFFCESCIRETFKISQPWNRGSCPICRQPCSLYDVRREGPGEESTLERPPVDTIFGEVYLQHGDPGVAAYHFDSPEDCYINYGEAPENWILGNGRKARQMGKKKFSYVNFNPATRTFTGTVNWREEHGFNGDLRWEYEMIFQDDFSTICGGHIKSFNAYETDTMSETVSETIIFSKHLIYWRQIPPPKNICGQIYMQGGCLGLASYHFERIPDDDAVGSPGNGACPEAAPPAPDGTITESINDDSTGAYINYEAAPPSWSMRNGTQPPKKKYFCSPKYHATTRTFTGTIVWGENSMSECAQWNYRMVFSEDFSTIESGEVRKFGVDGSERKKAQSKFGFGLNYERYDQIKAQAYHSARRISH